MPRNRLLPAALALVIAVSALGLGLGRNQGAAPSPQASAEGHRPLARHLSVRESTNDWQDARFGGARKSHDLEHVRLAQAPDNAEVDPNTVVVHFEKGTGADDMEAEVRAAGADSESTIPVLGTVVVDVQNDTRDDIIEALERNAKVREVESNRRRYPMVDPNDEYYFDQSHLYVSRLPIAWEVTKGSTALDIAILDTGVDLDHADLDGRLVAGRDIVDNDAVPQDTLGHGTMVAGIAAAETNNAIGVAGVAWNARIMPVRVLDSTGGYDSDIAAGIVWAVDHGAEVINMSLGGPGSSTILENAVAYALSHNVVVVAAAGNDGTSDPSFPAAIYDVVAVGATDHTGTSAYFSNWGGWVDLVAPGTDIVSTGLTSGADATYAIGDGTSFSSPIVAGVALLVRAKNPTWTAAQVATQLETSSADRGRVGNDRVYGGGLLDAYAAVGGRNAASPPLPPGDSLEPSDLPGNAVAAATTPVEATISPIGDLDWYYVDAPKTGTITFEVELEPQSGWDELDPIVKAYSPTLGSQPSSGTQLGETAVIPVAIPGRYFFQVSNRIESRGTGGYSVTATRTEDLAGFANSRLSTSETWPKSVAIADVTGDARNDVIAVTDRSMDPERLHDLYVFPQGSDGPLAEATTYAARGTAIATGDLDSDGDIDVAVGTADGVDLYFGANGLLSSPTTIAAGSAGGIVAIGDVTSDGIDDIVAQGVGGSRESVILRRSGGTWAVDVSGLPALDKREVVDLNADGRADIVGLDGGEIRTLLQQGNGTFVAENYGAPTGSYADLAIGELTGDGRLDVAAIVKGTGSAAVDLLVQNEGGGLAAPLVIDSTGTPTRLATADLDSDGLTDLMTINTASQGGVHLQQTDGSLTSEKLHGVSAYGGNSVPSLTVGDVDSSGRPDVVTGGVPGPCTEATCLPALGDRPIWVSRQLRPAPWSEELWASSVTPVERARNVSPSVRPTATFPQPLDPSSINAETARLLDAQSFAVVPASRSYNVATRTVTLTPQERLTPGRSYQISIANVGAADRHSFYGGFSSHFTVAEGVTPRADVNGDGYDDVIVGAPDEDFGTKTDAGAVHVMYGSASGAQTSGSQMWTQDTANVPDAAESGDRFGAAIATGDVNNDSYDDVAVGVPGENVGTVVDAGLVHLFLGSSTGLRASGSQTWTQNSSGVPDSAETFDKFGAALAFGDFDKPTGDDLAIGSPSEKVGTAANAGAVHVLSGRSTGLTASHAQLVTQTSLHGIDIPSASFGGALAAGDFDGDTHADLAIGAPTEDITDVDQGSVTFMRGTIVGLRLAGALFSELLTGVTAPRGERFGAALAVGDFGGLAAPDGYADIAVGAPGADSGAGRVDVLYSDWLGAGLIYKAARQTGSGNQPEAGDGFGAALGAGRVKGSATAWLAIGVPGENFGSATDGGAIHVVSPQNWVTTTPAMPAPLTQDSPNTPGLAENGDKFGAAVRVLDVDKDGAPDALVGSPNESFGSATTAGAAYVMRRAQPGGAVIGQYLYQGNTGVKDAVQSGDHFGAALGG